MSDQQMSFKQGLIRARSHLIFLFALISAFALVFWLESIDLTGKSSTISFEEQVEQTAEFEPIEPRPLTEKELEWANIAWKYFENNTRPETGLANSANKYTASTLWDTSSFLMAIISAYRIGVIDEDEFNTRIDKALTSLSELPLFEDKLPNKVFSTLTLDMVDYSNKATEKGIGWSAIDIGRVLVPFNILVWDYPQHSVMVNKVLESWDMSLMLQEGTMYGAAVTEDGDIEYPQEGRLGYEEYAAKSFTLMGMDVSAALDYLNFLNFVNVYDIEVATDSRDPSIYHAHNYVVSEPYILDGIEFGWDRVSREFAWRVFKAQELRYENTGILTAVSEDNIDQAPHFVYNTVFTGGKVWNAITESGEDASEFKSLSTKAVFGWHALYENDYTQKMMDAIDEAYDPEGGWYSGIYEKSGEINKILTANTNGIILETLAFRQDGQLMRIGK